MMWIATFLLLAIVDPSPAPAAIAPSPPSDEIVDPIWRPLSNPANFYPFRAMANEKVGVGVVRCVAEADGSLNACTLVCETPSGWDFGGAALSTARQYKLQPNQRDGRPIQGRSVTIPVHFNPSFLKPVPRCDRQ